MPPPRYPPHPPRPDMPAPRERLTLGELHEWHVVAIMCGKCGHAGLVEARGLRRRYGRDRRVLDLEMRMRCTRCRTRGGHGWTIVRMPR